MSGLRRYAPLTAGALMMLLGGCSGDDASPVTPLSPRTKLAGDVVVIDDDPALKVGAVGESSMVIYRLGGRELKSGDCLVGSAMGGFIRRARTVDADGDALLIGTEPATLTTAVISGYARQTARIGPGSTAAGGTAPLSGAGISLDGIELYGGSGEGQPRVWIESGSVAFDPEVDIELVIFGRRLKRLGVSMEGDLGIDIDVAAELPVPVSYSGSVEVARISRDLRMMIGPVPVPVTMELTVYLDTRIEGSLTEPCRAGYSGSSPVEAGISYSGSWETTGPAPAVSLEPAGFDIGPMSDGSVRATVRTELRVGFFGADEAVISAGPWIGAGSEIVDFPVWRWSLTGGISLRGSFTGGILDRLLPGFTAPVSGDSLVLGSGPFESGDFIFVREWGGLDRPRGIDTGTGGEVYVADQNHHRVVVYGRLGGYIREWGSYGTSPGSFIFPSGVAVAADGTVLVADQGNHRVQRFTPGGEFVGQWGSEGMAEGEFLQVEGIAAGPDSLVAVCDSGAGSFSVFTLEGRFIGRYPSPLARDAAFDEASVIYTSGCRSGGVVKTDRYGSPLGVIGPDLCVTGLAAGPAGIIYLLDYDLDRLVVLDPSGNAVSSMGSSGTGPGEFDRPGGVAVSPEGWVYISDTANGRIQIFAPR